MAPFLHHHIVPGFIQKRITSFIHTHNSQEGSSYTRKQKPENGNFYSSVTSLVQLKHNASILGLFRETGPTGIYAQKHTHTYIYTHIYIHIHIYVNKYKYGEGETQIGVKWLILRN